MFRKDNVQLSLKMKCNMIQHSADRIQCTLLAENVQHSQQEHSSRSGAPFQCCGTLNLSSECDPETTHLQYALQLSSCFFIRYPKETINWKVSCLNNVKNELKARRQTVYITVMIRL